MVALLTMYRDGIRENANELKAFCSTSRFVDRYDLLQVWCKFVGVTGREGAAWSHFGVEPILLDYTQAVGYYTQNP